MITEGSSWSFDDWIQCMQTISYDSKYVWNIIVLPASPNPLQ